MTRAFTLFAVSIAALLLIFLVVQSSAAQPPSQGSLQDGQPDSTPVPTATPPLPPEPETEEQPAGESQESLPEVDWASVQMVGEEEYFFPEVVTPVPFEAAEPDSAAPAPSESGQGPSLPSGNEPQVPSIWKTTHLVQSGETLYSIAKRYGISLTHLMATNNIQDPRRLQAGQVLIISGSGSSPQAAINTTQVAAGQYGGDTYLVQRGDKPFEIAQRFGVSVELLMEVNQITNPRRMYAGQLLTIPREGDAPVAAAAPNPTTPSVDPEVSSNPNIYVVQRGDNLSRIARKFGVRVQALISLNQISNPQRLDVGQVLTIPGEGEVPVEAATPAPVIQAVESAAPSSTNTYVVQRGDNLSKIASRFGVPIQTLIDINGLTSPDRINAGQTITINPALAVDPAAPSNPSVYVVQRGDILSHIANSFGVSIQALMEANSLVSPDRINYGQTLIIPSTNAVSSPESPTTSEPDASLDTSALQTIAEESTNPTEEGNPFIWPIPIKDGWFVKGYRAGHPGIDIILPRGTPIRASMAGTVEFSGWNAYGFGNLVVLNHGNGYRTLYAHQSERLVSTGDIVAQGDVIGLVGITGYATHPHLHFEIRQAYYPDNPCNYLPGGCQQQ